MYIAFPLNMRRWRWWYKIPLLGWLFPRRRASLKFFREKAVDAARLAGLDQLLDGKLIRARIRVRPISSGSTLKRASILRCRLLMPF